ncbi:hypothetical protein [Paenibacillus eucommiae]|uniref:Uncharacterized protein n=1 Tax=Paenibacillus eucommiae TaxID=1355755 RepID=A0ABS4IVE7_9BACL|nr:hypothetical protein [Paenibacillus eucommiae]MBP1991547.1 hypothetical protein [Paenibacillus eucommiae]
MLEENKNGNVGAREEEGAQAEPENRISRRKLLALLGMAGTAIATQSVLSGPSVALGKAENSVHGAVYGNPDYGASGSCCTIVSVGSIADLLNQSASDDLTYAVKSYYDSANAGGGDFFYKADEPKSSHNGGDIISSTVPWTGEASTLADFLIGAGETNPSGNGCYIRKACTLTPYMFGCLNGVDRTAGLQAFAARASNVKGSISWDIDMIVSDKIVFAGGAVDRPSSIQGTLNLQSNYASADWMLEIDNFPNTHIGSFIVTGKGSSVLAQRTNRKGAKITNVSGSVFGRMEAKFLKVQGIEVPDLAYHVKVESIQTYYCGFGITPVIGVVFTYTGHTLTGPYGTHVQYTEFTGVTNIPDEAEVGDSLVIGKNDYTITAIDRGSGTVKVQLWVTNDDFASVKSPMWCIGSGFKVAKSTTGPFSVGVITTLGCSVGYYVAQLYPGSVGKCSGESNLITVKLGTGPNTGHLGGSIDTVYAEAGRIAVSNNNVVGHYVIGNLDPMTCDQRISQCVGRYAIDFDVSKGAVEAADLDYQSSSVATAYKKLHIPVVDPSVYGPEVPITIVTGTSVTLSFIRDDFMTSGISSRILVFPRTGTRTITVTAGTGTTIGNPAAATQTLILSGSSLVFAEYFRASKNWILSRYDTSSVLVASTTYDAPSLSTGSRDPAPPIVTVNGATLGDFVEATLNIDTQGIELHPRVSALNAVTVEVVNPMSSTIDLPNATLTVRVQKR